MKPEIIASLIMSFISALGTIIVALIQTRSKKEEKPLEIIVPIEYKIHRPQVTKTKLWAYLLPITVLVGGASYFIFSWFYNSHSPNATQTDSISSTATPSVTVTQDLQSSLLSKNCINSAFWFSLDNEQDSDCLSLDNYGIFANDNGLTISSINDSSERIRHGIFTAIEKDTQITLKLTISNLYTPVNDDLANLSLGIISRSANNLETDTILVYQRESPQEGYPIFIKKGERGGIEAYLPENGGYKEYTKSTVQEILLDISNTNQLTIYIDGSPVIQVSVPFQDKIFWIGYRLSGNCQINAEISELQIQEK